THRRMELAVSFVAGVMLGVGLLHMLPHAFQARVEAMAAASGGEHALIGHEAAHEVMGPLMIWLLAGFLLMFFIERFFCFHHHDAPADDLSSDRSDDEPHHACGHDHGDGHEHHHHDESAGTEGGHRHRLTWTGAAIGLSLHTLIEGIALAASVEVAREDADQAALIGLGTFLVIVLHKPFDSLTLGTLMHLGKRSMLLRHAVNVGFALLVPVGVGMFYAGLAGGGAGRGASISAALAFSAGTFVCIASSDLLPELQFHQHDRVKLSASFLSGLIIAWAIGL